MTKFGWGSRKQKVAGARDVVVKRAPPDLDQDLFQKRAREIVGSNEILPYWRNTVQSLSAAEACELIGIILRSKVERVDGVIHPGETAPDPSVRHAEIDDNEKLVRIATVMACLAPPLAGRMFTADNDGVFFEAYNRISLSYLHDRHPAKEFAE